MAASTSTTSSPPPTGSPCAACKFLRRKCTLECAFAPYFPPDQPQRFVNVHKIFGASNVAKLINDVPLHQREDAVNSLVYEAEARMKDPVYGCVGAISLLQQKIAHLQAELAIARSELARYAAYTGTLMVPFHGVSTSGSPLQAIPAGPSPLSTVVIGSHEQAAQHHLHMQHQQQHPHHHHHHHHQQQHVALLAPPDHHDIPHGLYNQSPHATTDLGSSSASSGPSNTAPTHVRTNFKAEPA